MKLTTIHNIAPSNINWLWEGRIPYAGLTVLEGDGGLGKSFLTLHLASQVSRGGAGVLLLAAEDDAATTTRPRLQAMGADLGKVHIVEGEVSLSANLADIEAAVKEHNIKLIIVDPISYYLGADSKSEGAIRGALTPVVDLANRLGVAVVAIRHLSKNNKSRMGAGLGGVAIGALCRSGLRLEKSGDCVKIVNYKNNLTVQAVDVYFRIVDGKVCFVQAPTAEKSHFKYYSDWQPS